MISGKFKKTFKEANLAVVCGMHLSSDGPKWLRIESVDSGKVVAGGCPREMQEYEILEDRVGEFFKISHQGMYEDFIKSGPTEYKVRPFFDTLREE